MQTLHRSFVMNRRVQILAEHLASLIPETEPLNGLDVGCGSGEVAASICQLRSHVSIRGIDVLVRPQTQIPVQQFDGFAIPFPDCHFDFTMLVDVLHHADDAERLLAECVRVSRQFVLIKDHYCNSIWDDWRLRLMDWVGNRSYSVALPYNYLSTSQWKTMYDNRGLSPQKTIDKLHLYPQPVSLIFDSNLHFISRLKIGS
ncbi:MAG: SAM-dependent methyltransferase [Cyanobacteria bacterium J055]|nr:MAG: SAM-dependent methyltransferase [Cyanobacteria bacterium J055]